MPLFGPPNIEKMMKKGDVNGLLKALSDQKGAIRRQAAEALGQLGNGHAVVPLIAAIQGGDLDFRSVCVNSVKQIGDAAVDPLIAALKSPDKWLRVSAPGFLGDIGDARAVEPLISALKDKDGDMRTSVANGLGQLGDARAVEPLIVALKDANDAVRHRAVRALAKIGDVRAVVPLTTALKDSNSHVRLAADEALKILEKENILQEAWPIDNSIKENESAMWIFACYDHDRVSAMSMFSNTAHYFSEEYAIATVRNRFSINENQIVKFVKPDIWNAPNAVATQTSFDIDMQKVNSSILKYLESFNYKKSDVLDALNVSSDIPNPTLGILLICVDLR